jgi:hypothetical protein
VKKLSGAIATPSCIKLEEGVISGAVYNSSGVLVSESVRHGGVAGDHFISENQEIIEPLEAEKYLSGKAIYLGHYCQHYGHFITETLSNFWPLVGSDVEYDHYVFHEFPGGSSYSGAFVEVCSRLSIPLERVVIVKDMALKFEILHLYPRAWILNQAVDPRASAIYSFLSATYSSVVGVNPPNKYYLSRRKQSKKTGSRVLLNEYVVERLFEKAGYVIIYPEEFTFREQLRLFSNASSIAGVSGTALHNSLFMKNGQVIELVDPRYMSQAPNQVVCNELSGVGTVFISCMSRVFASGDAYLYNYAPIETELGVKIKLTLIQWVVAVASLTALIGRVILKRFKTFIRNNIS